MNAIDIFIFAFGVFVTLAAVAGAFLIGLSEAADSGQARPDDLTDLERRFVKRDDE